MPANVSLVSGKELRCDDEPEQVVEALRGRVDHGFVALNVGGHVVWVRPEHVAAVSRTTSRTAHFS